MTDLIDGFRYEPYLYILMRSDLDSLNLGKACAQAAHAANQFVRRVHQNYPLFNRWQESTPDGFGTTIVLDVDGATLGKIVDFANLAGFPSGVVHDPSYPIRDGQVTHLIPLNTCGYIFGDKLTLAPLLRQFNLLK